jgi:hypothetical protein
MNPAVLRVPSHVSTAPGSGSLESADTGPIVTIDARGMAVKRGRASRFSPAQVEAIRRQAETTPVAELARRRGVTRQCVYILIRGRRSPDPPRPGTHGGRWTAGEDELVRTLPVASVVARTGRSPSSVRSRRHFLGVAAPAARPWTAREDDLVRRLPPAEAAARTGRGRAAVQTRRKKLGVTAARHWTPAEDRLVRTLRPLLVARRVGRSVACVYKRRQKLGLRDGHANKGRRVE